MAGGVTVLLGRHLRIDEVFYHCAKSFLRSQLWQPTTWAPTAVPSRAATARLLEHPDEAISDLEQYYGAAYAERLYRPS